MYYDLKYLQHKSYCIDAVLLHVWVGRIKESDERLQRALLIDGDLAREVVRKVHQTVGGILMHNHFL